MVKLYEYNLKMTLTATACLVSSFITLISLHLAYFIYSFCVNAHNSAVVYYICMDLSSIFPFNKLNHISVGCQKHMYCTYNMYKGRR